MAGLLLPDAVRWTLPAGCDTIADLSRASWMAAPAETPAVAAAELPDPEVVRKVSGIVSGPYIIVTYAGS